MIDFHVTVYPTAVATSYDPFEEPDNPSPPPPHRKRPQGFCLNVKCAPRHKQVKFSLNLRKAQPVSWYTPNRHHICCPKCEHALYWTRVWHLEREY